MQGRLPQYRAQDRHRHQFGRIEGQEGREETEGDLAHDRYSHTKVLARYRGLVPSGDHAPAGHDRDLLGGSSDLKKSRPGSAAHPVDG